MAKINTYKAMIIAIISMCLCIVMLCGMTFAWYRASLTSADNVIKTGIFDVSFGWASHANSDSWTTLTTSTKLFNTNEMEPGSNQVYYVKIVNATTAKVRVTLNLDGVSAYGGESDMNYYTKFDVGTTDVAISSMTASGTVAAPQAATYELDPQTTVIAAVGVELSLSSLHPATETRFKLAFYTEQLPPD